MPALLANNSKRSETMVVRANEDTKAKDAEPIPSEIKAPSATSTVDTMLEIATGEAGPAASDTFEHLTGPSTLPGNIEALPESDKPKSASQDDSTSAGTKAGIAFGVIGAALLIGWLIFFFVGRRKKTTHKKKRSVDTEKHAGRQPEKRSAHKHDQPAVVRSLATDVATDNRPVTTFFPGRPGVNKPLPVVEEVALPPAVALPTSRNAPNDNAWERPTTSHSTHSANPFGRYAERIPSPETPPMPSRSPSPIMVNQALPRGEEPAGSYEPSAAVAPLAPLARKTSLRKDNVPRLDVGLPRAPKMAVVPASPAPTEYSMTSVAPSVAPSTAGAPALPNSTVHRVQQEFEPTMEDEIELKAGQLVRLLHEFDDGWVSSYKRQLSKGPKLIISNRLCAPAWTCPSRALFPEHACQLVLSSLAPRAMPDQCHL
ncbi:hypothetical protein HJFPF1_03190 [Paramyrothecium foliicola]|nr:hypothetical protein HJFPF1_03190 [Paramyrothecium foliicola]